MDAAQVAEKLLAVEREFARYRVEMALYVDKLERRLEEAESNLRRVTFGADVTGSHSLNRSFAPGFSERRPDLRAPATINTASSFQPTPGPVISPSLFTKTAAHSGTPRGDLLRPSHGSAHPPSNKGSGENAAFLPYAIEKIAATSQKKPDGDRRTCACGRPIFDLNCFREHHFDWCRLHQRAMVSGRYKCAGNDHRDCQAVRWEKHPDWERIVKCTFDSGNFGFKKVNNLYELLFPIEEYPHKYENGWYVG